MIESAAYEIIKKEGFEEGLKAGIEQGIQQGLLKAIELGLKIKFGVEGMRLYRRARKIKDVDFLEALAEAIEAADDLSQIERLLAEANPEGN
ncbi:MAG: hypothetical protein Q9N26_03635 [Aquificota bacterium]|nr:hypothetical protein [Aquificota bacterium]